MPDGDISLGSVKCNSIKTKWSTLLVESKDVCVVNRLELLEQKKSNSHEAHLITNGNSVENHLIGSQ